jgi:hypothetical protein
MVSGVLADKSKKERLKPLFFMLDAFRSTNGLSRLKGSKLHILWAFSLLVARLWQGARPSAVLADCAWSP